MAVRSASASAPCRFGLSKISYHLVFCLFLRGDFLSGPYEAENLPRVVAHGETMHLNPPHLPVGTEDTKAFIELAAVSRFFQFCEHMPAVFGMDEVFIGGRIFHQRVA